MNVMAALIGYVSFMAAIVAMCLLVFFNADRLEAWARRRFGKKQSRSNDGAS